ncbi:SDR family NAD(P)-dependent oxidoreductase [Modestobacter sp. SYSU DS0657]
MGARGRRLPRLRGVPDPDRPGDPGLRGRAGALSAPPADQRPVAVVTGASDGIGAAAARRLHRAGWRVVVGWELSARRVGRSSPAG